MKSILPVLVAAILLGCTNYEIAPGNKVEAPGKSSGVTWELIEIRNLVGEWRTVTDSEKHFLTFINDSTVEYSDLTELCRGQYLFDILENSVYHSERLILQVPCMVPAPQLWWEHLIESQSDDEIVTYPQLTPTAYMSYERFKYKITYSTKP